MRPGANIIKLFADVIYKSLSVYYTKLEKLAMDKHSSLLRTFVNYVRKKFYKIGPRWVPSTRPSWLHRMTRESGEQTHTNFKKVRQFIKVRNSFFLLKKHSNLFYRKGIKEIREFMPREQVPAVS